MMGLVICALSMSSVSAGDRIIDYPALEGRGFSVVVATMGRTEFYFEDSVLSNFPAGSILGLVGEKKGIKKGQEIARQFEIADPAIEISKTLAGALADRLKLEATYAESDHVTTPQMLWSMRDPAALSASLGQGKLVVDVRSTSWAVALLGKDRYRVGYWANAQVVDTSTGKVIASKQCVQKPKKKSDAPKVVNMFVDDAAELKAEIKATSNVCLKMFMTDMLGIPPAKS
jgi:hypothetical protein